MSEILERECRVLTRYLVGLEPDAYVIGKYVDFHQRRIPARIARFDCALVDAAMAGRLLTWAADAYTAAFRRNAALRRKLVLIAALLECRPPFSDHLDTPRARGRLSALAALALQALSFGTGALVSLAVFTPVRLWCALRAGGDSSV